MARGLRSSVLLGVAICAFSAKGHAANGLFCQGTLSYPDGYHVCVGSQATADYVRTLASLGLGPDRMAVAQAATGEVATSSFGASSAEASATVGVLSGKTHAEVLTKMSSADQDPNWTSGGLASAAFRDTVLIQGRPGVPLGTPVTAHLRTVVQGAFSAASPKGVLAAEADFSGQVYLLHGAGGQVELPVPLSGVYWSYEGHVGGTSDTVLPNVKTGDSLDIRWALRIESSVNQVSTLSRTDSEVVAQLFLDLEPSLAIAVGQTAYDYRGGSGSAGEGGAGGADGAAGAPGSDAGAAGSNAGAPGSDAGAAGSDAEPSSNGGSEAVSGAGEGGESEGSAEASGGRGSGAGASSGGTSSGSSSSSSGCALTRAGQTPERTALALLLSAGLLVTRRRRRARSAR